MFAHATPLPVLHGQFDAAEDREGRMTEHFTRNTVSAEFFCSKCGKSTQHRIDGGRKGPCLVCMFVAEAKRDGIPIRERNGELEIQANDATFNYLCAGIAGKRREVIVSLVCTCRSFRFPHSPERHKDLRYGDLDWRTWEERKDFGGEVFPPRSRTMPKDVDQTLQEWSA